MILMDFEQLNNSMKIGDWSKGSLALIQQFLHFLIFLSLLPFPSFFSHFLSFLPSLVPFFPSFLSSSLPSFSSFDSLFIHSSVHSFLPPSIPLSLAHKLPSSLPPLFVHSFPSFLPLSLSRTLPTFLPYLLYLIFLILSQLVHSFIRSVVPSSLHPSIPPSHTLSLDPCLFIHSLLSFLHPFLPTFLPSFLFPLSVQCNFASYWYGLYPIISKLLMLLLTIKHNLIITNRNDKKHSRIAKWQTLLA